MFCHIVDDVGCYGRVILLPFILLFVVPCGTYLNYDEDLDILVKFYFMIIFFYMFFKDMLILRGFLKC